MSAGRSEACIRGSARAGFTLIETLVALVVVAVVAVVTQRGVAAARFGLDRAQSTLAAEAVARSLVETELARLAPGPGVVEGETDGLGWRVAAEPLDLPFPPPPPQRAAPRVTSAEATAALDGNDDTKAPNIQRGGEQPQQKWLLLRVLITVQNGRARPLAIETVHAAKAP